VLLREVYTPQRPVELCMYVSTLERPVLLLEVYLHHSIAHEGSETGSGSGAGAEVGAETSLKGQ
jgi:hypothetical protein